MWTERYRPRKFEDIVGNQDQIVKIRDLVATGNIPHMLFEGQAGTGKTTTALTIGRVVFGENFRAMFMELNASDQRKIETVREVIKPFAKSVPLQGSFKIIFLDEADAITKDAQNALRRIMEEFNSVTRFILSANYVDKIIEPLRSRCSLFHFSPISKEDIYLRLKYIAGQEKVSEKFNDDTLMEVADVSSGDLRSAINSLQQLAVKPGQITRDDIVRSFVSRYPELIIQSIRQKKFMQARFLVRKFLEEGYDERDLVDQLHTYLLSAKELPAKWRGEAILLLAETDTKLVMGSNPSLQSDWLVLKMTRLEV